MTGYDGRGARFDITVVEGNDLSFTVTAVDSDSVAVDLSSATIVGTVYNSAGTAIDTLTAAVGGAGSNVITLSLTDTEVDALVDPKSWALVVTRSSDDRTWLAGKFNVVAADRARNGTSGTAVTATVDTNVTVTVSGITSATAFGLSLIDDVDAAAARATLGVAGVFGDTEPAIPLSIPTFDGDLNVTHPSVVFFPDRFQGWFYWMAFTPWPDADREFPSVVVSNDGVNWEVPAGLTNPIVQTVDDIISDPHLVYDADTSALWLYYRRNDDTPSAYEKVCRRTSTDGVTWSAEVDVVTLAADNDDLLSPTVSRSTDGNWIMWHIDLAVKMQYRTSTDGLTWSAASDCTIPDNLSPSHFDAVLVGDLYHGLLLSDNANSLHYLTSSDGITWSGDRHRTFLFRSQTGVDVQHHYRSSLIPRPGQPLAFDIVLSWRERSTDNWGFYLYRGFDPNMGDPGQVVKGSTPITIPGGVMTPRNGSSAQIVANRWPAVRFPDTGLTQAIANLPTIPSWWQKFRVHAFIVNETTNAGDVKIGLTMSTVADGATLNADNFSGGGNTTHTVIGQNLLQVVDLGTLSFPGLVQRDINHLRIDRRPTDAEDTLTGNLAVVAIRLTPEQ